MTTIDAINLGRLEVATLERLGDYPALWFEGKWHNAFELHERAARVSGGLRELGIEPGARVVVMMANCPEVTVVYRALWRAGAVVTPAIFLITAPELRHILVDSGAAAVIITPEMMSKAREAADGLEVRVIVVDTEDFAALEASKAGDLVDRAGDDLAALLYTGGTTGRSKGVPLTNTQLIRGGAAAREVSYVPGVNRVMLALPLAHAFGILVTVVGLHATEPPVTLLQRWFEPSGWLTLAQEHRAQTAAVVPSMLAMLLAQPLEDFHLSELRYVSCGAAPLPVTLAQEFERRVPSATIHEGYGCTETAGIISATPPGRRRLGKVGIPVPGVQVRIVSDGGEDLPPGEPGEIVVRGPNVMAGYWGSRDGLAGDGWFPTGDIGMMDADGYLSIVDRKKDLIIRGGHNVFPRDVEDVLLAHPAVAAAAVVGRPDERLGEEVVAFVSIRPGASDFTIDSLSTHARERLSALKYPREIRIVDAIPLTSVGKVDRKLLRSLL